MEVPPDADADTKVKKNKDVERDALDLFTSLPADVFIDVLGELSTGGCTARLPRPRDHVTSGGTRVQTRGSFSCMTPQLLFVDFVAKPK